MPTRPFIDTLTALRYGELHDELSEKLNELVTACSETGKAGALTLTLKLKPSKGGAMEISDEVKSKVPKLEHGSTLMFPTPEGNLQREDPRQLKLEGLREVPRETGEIRNVGQA
jgi:hypothetical protein